MIKNLLISILISSISIFGVINTSFSGNVPESNDPIRVVMNDWTGQYVSTKIAGELLKKMGYNVEYITAGALPQLPAFAQGELDIQTEIWTNNVSDAYHEGINYLIIFQAHACKKE